MVEVEQESKPRSEQELMNDFKEQLQYLNTLYKEIQSHKIYGDFYIGPNLVYTNLPDKVRFKRTTTEIFG